MAELKLVLGAVADVVTTGEMKDGFTGLQGHIDKRFQANAAQCPIRRKLFASGASSVLIGTQTVSTVVCAETPNVGRYWVVRSISTFNAATPLTAEYAANIAFLAVGNAAAPSTSDLTGDTWSGIPHANTYNSTSVRVTPNQNIYMVLNATITDDVALVVEIDEYMDTAFNAQRL